MDLAVQTVLLASSTFESRLDPCVDLVPSPAERFQHLLFTAQGGGRVLEGYLGALRFKMTCEHHTDWGRSAPAGDATSTYPDYYFFVSIKTKNALFDFFPA